MVRGVTAWGRTRETVSAAAGKVLAAADDTRSAILGIAGLAVLALLVGLAALILGMRGRKVAE